MNSRMLAVICVRMFYVRMRVRVCVRACVCVCARVRVACAAISIGVRVLFALDQQTMLYLLSLRILLTDFGAAREGPKAD